MSFTWLLTPMGNAVTLLQNNVERCKSLVKNFDRTLARSNAKLQLGFIRLILKRLAIA
ncbi:MAG: hypothetical protein ACBR13_15770 [Microcoleus sp.]